VCEFEQVGALRHIFEDDYKSTAETYSIIWEISIENPLKRLRSAKSCHREEWRLLIVYVIGIPHVKDGYFLLQLGYHGSDILPIYRNTNQGHSSCFSQRRTTGDGIVNWNQQQKESQSSPYDVVVILDYYNSAAAIPEENDVSSSGIFDILTYCTRNRYTERDEESLFAALTKILPELKDEVFSLHQLIQLWSPPIRLRRCRALRPTEV
jgi:hypothetical protein